MGETFPSNSLSAQLGTSNSGVSGAGTGTGKHGTGTGNTAWVAHGAVPMPWPGLQNKPGWMNTARGCAPTCCLPWGAPGRPDPLAHTFLALQHKQGGQHGQPGGSVVSGRSSAATRPSLSRQGSAWVISSTALFISVRQERRLTEALKE